MQASSTSPAQASHFEWRLSAWMLMATLLSMAQGCAIVSDAPHQPISNIAIAPPEIRSNPPIDPPETDALSLENPSTASIPQFRNTDEAPPTATLPAPPAPKLVETGMASWYGAK